MIAKLHDFKTGWHGISIALKPSEIAGLIDRLKQLESSKLGHFHFRSDFSQDGGIGDVEISLMGDEERDNLTLD
jgi:hypothetical protein